MLTCFFKVSEEERDFEEEEEKREYDSFKAYIDKHKEQTDTKVKAQKK